MVNLVEKIELHTTLNPKLWDLDSRLDEEVADKLQEIVDQFILELEENNIPIKVLDAHLVGSNASFNYTDESDLDVHIVANFESVTCDPTLLNLLYNFFKKYFNDKYEISIHGIPIELYVEDVNAATVSNGIYSLFNHEWVKFPEPIEIPDIDITDVFAPYEDRYNEIIEEENASEAEDLVNELYLLRKNALTTGGEYSTGNLVFKEFRNLGYLDGLKQLVTDERAKELSLESLLESLDNNLLLEDAESQRLFRALQHYLGTRRERVSNPSGSGINKGGDIQDAKHHVDMSHGEKRPDDIEIKNFRKHSSDHYTAFKNAFNHFVKKAGELFPKVPYDDLTMLINHLSDSASVDMFRARLDAVADRYEKYSDRLKDLKNLLDDTRARYRNAEFDIKLEESRHVYDVGYHYGDLGKADYRHQFGNRNTGGFGTGTYFVGKPINREEGRNSRSSRPEHVVDFSDYKLYKPLSNNQAYRLHDALLYFNNYSAVNRTIPTTWEKILDEYEEVMDDVFSTADQVEPVNGANLFDTAPLLKYIRKYIEYYPRKITEVDYYSLKDISKEIEEARLEESDKFYSNVNSLLDALRYSVSEDRLVKIIKAAIEDSSDIAPSTLIMQKLGYDGIDVRHLNHDDQGLSGLDNFGYGSVIYDLKEGFDEKEIVAGVEDFLASLGEKSVSLNWLRTQSKDNSATEPRRQYVNQLEDVELKAVGKRLGIKMY